MSNALRWMLQCISGIVSSGNGPLNLLEMYCGCGAHTIALAKSGMLDRILAVELDRRLVEACETNISINGLGQKVKVVQGDAGKWAKEHKKRPKEDYSILLGTLP
jgi:tRNA (uracil-5-)-methyltransferase